VVKGVQFANLIEAGDPVEMARKYADQGADELVFLDITATQERRMPLSDLVARIAKAIDIPFTVGGGIKSVSDGKALLEAGADKLSINSASVYAPELISGLSEAFGSQCVVQAIDTRYTNQGWEVFTHGGSKATGLPCLDWARAAVARGAGEILLTAMGNDGAKKGFALDITAMLATAVLVPVIASGGAGCMAHFETLFATTKASAALAASIFHFDEIGITELKQFLKSKNIPVR
jgi:cyclase